MYSSKLSTWSIKPKTYGNRWLITQDWAINSRRLEARILAWWCLFDLRPLIQKMFALFLLIPVLLALNLGLLLSAISLYFIGRRKPKVGKNNLGCFLGICFGVCVWMMLIGLVHVGGTSANDMDGFPALLLKIFLFSLTPVAALPALMTYGPGTKWLTFDPMSTTCWRIILMEMLSRRFEV